MLIAEGVADYRYLHTLDAEIAHAEAAKTHGVALDAARKFRAALRANIPLDLSTYYEHRHGSYAENWYMRQDNPWRPERFEQTRRQAADHILALQADGADMSGRGTHK